MKLVAKAKPVKIRIKSGGEEHSSLDSLKMNFCINDVKELLDGRLSRWLKQQNEILLAVEIDKFESRDLNSDDKCLEFIKLLFNKELESVEITSLFDLAKHWYTEDNKYKRNGELLFRQRLLEYNLEAAKYAYKNEFFPNESWIRIFMIFKNSKDPESLYLLGKLLFDNSSRETANFEHGYKLIKEAAAYGWEEAIKFELDKVYQKTTDRFWGVNRDKITNNIIRRWKELTLEDYKYASNEKEKQIIQFIFTCKKLYFSFDNSFNNPWLIAKEAFHDRECHLLAYDMKTIIAILENSNTAIKRELESIKDNYLPANYIYYQRYDFLYNSVFNNLNKRNKIAFIVQHLFDFN